MKSWTDVDYAQAAIDMLPGTVEEIEEFMRVHKIKGQPNSSRLCPVANWMMRWTGGAVSVGFDTGGPLTALERVAIPEAVREFIYKFDDKFIKL